MTPETFARNLARSADLPDRALGVAIIARGLSDDTLDRAGWPLADSVTAAIRFLGISDPSGRVALTAAAIAPTVSDAMLNTGGRPIDTGGIL